MALLAAPTSPPPPYRHSPSIPFIMNPNPNAITAPPAEAPRIQAYARLEFIEGYDFYIRTLPVTIGRRPLATVEPVVEEETGKLEAPPQPVLERSPVLRPVSDARSSPPVLHGVESKSAPPPPPPPQTPAPAKAIHVDVDLGPIKAVSRDHAQLFYDYKAAGWALDVRGRNGVVVDGHWHSTGDSVPLVHGTRIQIAERVFYFMLPMAQVSSDMEDDSATDFTSDHSNSPSVQTATPAKPASTTRARGRGRGRGRGRAQQAKPKPAPRESPLPEPKKLPARVNRGKGKQKEDYTDDPLAPLPDDEPVRSAAASPSVPIKVKLTIPPKPMRFPVNDYVGKPDKPPYTMTSLVGQAAAHGNNEQVTVAEATRWIKAAYPYFKGDSSLNGEVDRRLKDTRYFEPGDGSAWRLIPGDGQPQYFDGLVFRKRAQAAVPATATPPPPQPVASTSTQPVASTSTVEPVPVEQPVAAVKEESATPAPQTAPVAPAPASSAPMPIVIEPLPEGYDPATAPLMAGLSEPPIAIHQGKMILSPSVFKHLLKDTAKLEQLRKLPTDKAIAALRQFVVAFLKAKAAKAESKKRAAESPVGSEQAAKVAKTE